MIDSLYTLTALELFVGGGGRLLELGPITLRMVLFALCLGAALWMMAFDRWRDGAARVALTLAAAYLLTHLPAMLMGLYKGAALDDIAADLQPSLYWLAAPFFAAALTSVRLVRRTAKLVMIAGVALAIVYIGTAIGLLTGVIDFVELYARIGESGEFFFRGESFFFYKGFLYLAVSAVFLTALPGRVSKLGLLLVVAALVLTLTRGFVLATGIAVLLMLLATRRWLAATVVALVASAALVTVWLALPTLSDDTGDQREVSDTTRLDDLSFIADRSTPLTILVGEGFGEAINGRQNIENTYVWLLWKMGAAGLGFWAVPFLVCRHYFRRVDRRHPDYSLACAYFFATVLVYVQTATNPFLNNPIGLSFVLIALFSLRTLATAPRRVSLPTATMTATPSLGSGASTA